MSAVFLDTSFLIALVLSDDEHHARAVAWQRATRCRLITTEYVLVELMDALSRATLRDLAVRIVEALTANAEVSVVPASAELLRDGFSLYRTSRDKDWGATDCISFAAMRAAGVREALTSDHHFEQAGFRALLRHAPPE